MKKVILAALVAVSSLSANAQVYLGGNLGFNTGKAADGADNTMILEIAPEIGYNLNEKVAIGLQLGFTTQNGAFVEGVPASYTKSSKNQSTFSVAPYVRYTFAKSGIASFFVDGGVGLTFYNNDGGNVIGIGVRPGVAIAASEKVSFVAKTGYLGYQFESKKAGKGNVFGLGLDQSALSFGIFYNF